MDAPNPIKTKVLGMDSSDLYASDAAREVRDLGNAATNPLGTAINKLIEYSQYTASTIVETRLILEEIRSMEAERKRVTGFSTARISYDPADGIKVFDTSKQQGAAPTAFTLVTAQRGADPTTPGGKTIYGAFGRNLITNMDSAGTFVGPPRNFDFLLVVNQKIERYAVRHGLEAISLWSQVAFDGILYMTAGHKHELPDFF